MDAGVFMGDGCIGIFHIRHVDIHHVFQEGKAGQ